MPKTMEKNDKRESTSLRKDVNKTIYSVRVVLTNEEAISN